jgi:hypothetical protein
MGREDREFIRVNVRLLTWLKFPNGQVLRSLTKDVSGAGVCVVTEGTVEPGTLLEVEIKLPDREAPIKFMGGAVWSKAVAEPAKAYQAPTAETGVRFVSIDPKEQALILQYAKLNAIPEG